MRLQCEQRAKKKKKHVKNTVGVYCVQAYGGGETFFKNMGPDD